MTVVPVLLLCSLALVAGAIVLFVFSAKQGDCHESERLCLMPLEDDAAPARDPALPESPEPR
ncbi:MAG: cytochrome oxidase [Planctomycetes bacterium]|nr:cytochrome oxidase [Planctomycetota bacterium]